MYMKKNLSGKICWNKKNNSKQSGFEKNVLVHKNIYII